MILSMRFFLGLICLMGLILTIYSFKIAPSVKNCDSKTQNSLRGLLVMGVIMMSVPSTAFACGCGMKTEANKILGNVLIILMLIVGIITISLSSIIHGACEDARKHTPFLITMSVLLTVGSGGYLIYHGYKAAKGPNKSSF